MADVRESFPVLEGASQEGLALRAIQEGDAPTSKNGILGFAFTDSAGNVILPQLTAEGKVPVDFEGAGVSKSATSNGVVAGALTNTLICEVSLTASKTYGKVSARGACFREAIFQLIQVNDVTETILDEFIVGPGQFSYLCDLGQTEFISGATGAQKLQLKAMNLSKASDFRGSIACLEFVA